MWVWAEGWVEHGCLHIFWGGSTIWIPHSCGSHTLGTVVKFPQTPGDNWGHPRMATVDHVLSGFQFLRQVLCQPCSCHILCLTLLAHSSSWAPPGPHPRLLSAPATLASTCPMLFPGPAAGPCFGGRCPGTSTLDIVHGELRLRKSVGRSSMYPPNSHSHCLSARASQAQRSCRAPCGRGFHGPSL